MPSADDSKNPCIVLRGVAPTLKHARALVTLVIDTLGERAHIVSSGEGRTRRVYLRDAAGVVPWPLVSLSVADPETLDAEEADAAADAAESWKGPETSTPSGFVEMRFHAVPAALSLWDGPVDVSVNYERDGKWRDGTGPIDPGIVAAMTAAIGTGADSRLALLASWIARIDSGRHGPARLVIPHPMSGGPEGVWGCARRALRLALAEGRAPAEACWAVADGVAGTAVAFGPTRDAALASWREVVHRVRPTPPPPSAPLEPGTTFEPPSMPGDGPRFFASFSAQSSGWDAPVFHPSPETTPAAVVPLEAIHAGAVSTGVRTRLLGNWGTTEHALRLPRPGGFCFVGEALADRVDLSALAEARRRDRRNAPNAAMRRALEAQTGVELRTSLRWFRCLDAATGAPCAPIVHQSAQVPEFDPGDLDGSSLRHSILEVTPLE